MSNDEGNIVVEKKMLDFRFTATPFTYIIFFFSLVVFLMGLAAAFLGGAVLLITSLRVTLFETGIFYLLVGIFFIGFAVILLKAYSPKNITIDGNRLKIRKWILKSTTYDLTDTKYIEVRDRSNFFNSFAGPKYEILILALNYRISIRVQNFKDHQNLLSYFLNLESQYNDEFLKFYFYRSRGSILRRLLSVPTGIFGFVIFFLLVIIYSWAGLVNFIHPIDQRKWEILGLLNPEYLYVTDPAYRNTAKNMDPNTIFRFGTDFLGRDFFSRLVFGTYFTLNIVIIVTILTVAIAVVIGTISGYIGTPISGDHTSLSTKAGSTFDQLITGVMDMLLAFPPFAIWMFATSLIGKLRTGFTGGYYLQAFLLMVPFIWASPARVIRSEVQALKREEYVQAEVVYGASSTRILTRHILPNLFPLIMAVAISSLVDFLVATLTISIILPGEGSLIWGSDIGARLNPDYYPSQSIFDPYLFRASLWFSIIILGLILFTDTLKDVLDPRFEIPSSKKIANSTETRVNASELDFALLGEEQHIASIVEQYKTQV